MQSIRDCKVQAHSAPDLRKPMYAGIYFCDPSRDNFSYCAPLGDVGLWESHRDLVGSFVSSSLSEWMLDMETWENTAKAEEEEELLKHRSDPDNK